jgi:hypothetical protein
VKRRGKGEEREGNEEKGERKRASFQKRNAGYGAFFHS